MPPASQAPQPGSGLIQVHSAVNSTIAGSQYARPTRRPPTSAHQPAISSIANQTRFAELLSPTMAIPALAAAAYTSSSGGRCARSSNTAMLVATTAAITVTGIGGGCS